MIENVILFMSNTHTQLLFTELKLQTSFIEERGFRGDTAHVEIGQLWRGFSTGWTGQCLKVCKNYIVSQMYLT